ncbi:hypothetical protein Tco_0789264, partial [Tanacetum coccineum]
IGSESRSKEKSEDGEQEVVVDKIQSKVAGIAAGGIRRKLDISELVNFSVTIFDGGFKPGGRVLRFASAAVAGG